MEVGVNIEITLNSCRLLCKLVIFRSRLKLESLEGCNDISSILLYSLRLYILWIVKLSEDFTIQELNKN